MVYIHVVIVYYKHILLSEVSHLTHDSYEEDDITEWYGEMTAKSSTFKFWTS